MFELSQSARVRTHTKPKSAVLRLIVSHGWSIRSPNTDTPHGEKDSVWGRGETSQTPKEEKRKEEKCGCVGGFPNVRTLVKLPGPQVGLYKAHSGIKW